MTTPIFKVGPMPPAQTGIKQKASFNIDFSSYSNYYTPYIFRDLNQISEPFRLVVAVLKALGNSPISSRRISSRSVNEPERVIFEVNYFSVTTISSAVIAFLMLILSSLFFINIGLGQSFLVTGIISYHDFDRILREEESSANPVRGMVQKTYVITACIMVGELISRWWHAKKFVHFLNKWNGFELKLAKAFPHFDYDYDFLTLMNLRDNLILFYVTYPSMVLIPAFLVVYCSRFNVFAKLLGILICSQFIAVSLLEDVKVIMSYKALQQAFHQVRKCIVHFKKIGGTMDADVALSWGQLIQYIREQCDRASRYQKFEELFRLIGYTGLVTLFVYIILNGWDHAQKRGSVLFILSSVGYGGMLLGRIYFKAVMADEIAQEEFQVARAVLKIDTKNCDHLTNLELKTLVDVITLSPAKISFGNYITLNKRLLLAICSQIVTYLIVLMQFSQPNK
ncbi:unnamed protein product [Allacma fusca]|uniref:Gustatory receptor n=1 Tax=Allacma fusca TaxID=39272 RepID=A0A8J2LMT1_9HEXA|nr:unnamed protein product [Allacma fusca]